MADKDANNVKGGTTKTSGVGSQALSLLRRLLFGFAILVAPFLIYYFLYAVERADFVERTIYESLGETADLIQSDYEALARGAEALRSIKDADKNKGNEAVKEAIKKLVEQFQGCENDNKKCFYKRKIDVKMCKDPDAELVINILKQDNEPQNVRLKIGPDVIKSCADEIQRKYQTAAEFYQTDLKDAEKKLLDQLSTIAGFGIIVDEETTTAFGNDNKPVEKELSFTYVPDANEVVPQLRTAFPSIEKDCALRHMCMERAGGVLRISPIEKLELPALRRLGATVFLTDRDGHVIEGVGPAADRIVQLPLSPPTASGPAAVPEGSTFSHDAKVIADLLKYIGQPARAPGSPQGYPSNLDHDVGGVMQRIFYAPAQLELPPSLVPATETGNKESEATQRIVSGFCVTHKDTVDGEKADSLQYCLGNQGVLVTDYMVAVLLPKAQLDRESFSPPVAASTIAILLFTAILALVPVAKLQLLEGAQPLRPSDVWMAAGGGLLLLAICTIAIADALIYQNARASVRETAETIAKRAHRELDKEITSLNGMDKPFPPEFFWPYDSQIGEPYLKYSSSSKINRSLKEIGKDDIVRNRTNSKYFQSSAIPVGDRKYFQNIKNYRGWASSDPSINYYADFIRAKTTGELELAYIEARGKNDPVLIAMMPEALDRPLLPRGMAMALVLQSDDGGRAAHPPFTALFHTRERQSLVENVVAQAGGDVRLHQLLSMGQAGIVEADYRGSRHLIAVQPMYGPIPWSVVVMADLGELQVANMEMVLVSLVLSFAWILLLMLVLGWAGRGQFPKREKGSEKRSVMPHWRPWPFLHLSTGLTFQISVLAIAIGIMTMLGSSSANLINLILLLIVPVLILRLRPHPAATAVALVIYIAALLVFPKEISGAVGFLFLIALFLFERQQCYTRRKGNDRTAEKSTLAVGNGQASSGNILSISLLVIAGTFNITMTVYGWYADALVAANQQHVAQGAVDRADTWRGALRDRFDPDRDKPNLEKHFRDDAPVADVMHRATYAIFKSENKQGSQGENIQSGIDRSSPFFTEIVSQREGESCSDDTSSWEGNIIESLPTYSLRAAGLRTTKPLLGDTDNSGIAERVSRRFCRTEFGKLRPASVLTHAPRIPMGGKGDVPENLWLKTEGVSAPLPAYFGRLGMGASGSTFARLLGTGILIFSLSFLCRYVLRFLVRQLTGSGIEANDMDMAAPPYQTLRELLTIKDGEEERAQCENERNALFFFARHGYLNMSDDALVRSLMRKQLIERRNGNEYLLGEASPPRDQWRQDVPAKDRLQIYAVAKDGRWQLTRIPFTIFFVGIAVFLVYTSPTTVQTLIALITAALGLTPILREPLTKPLRQE